MELSRKDHRKILVFSEFADTAEYLHKKLLEIKQVIEKNEDTKNTILAAKKLNNLIDLLLISYCKAELTFDNEDKMTAEELVEELRINWGRFLQRYLKKLEE